MTVAKAEIASLEVWPSLRFWLAWHCIGQNQQSHHSLTNTGPSFRAFSACIGAFPPAFELMIKTLREYIGGIDASYILAYLVFFPGAMRIFRSDFVRALSPPFSVPLTHHSLFRLL